MRKKVTRALEKRKGLTRKRATNQVRKLTKRAPRRRNGDGHQEGEDEAPSEAGAGRSKTSDDTKVMRYPLFVHLVLRLKLTLVPGIST